MCFRRSHRASPKGARRWRLYRALEYVLGISNMISHKLSILVGDYCFLGLLHRECLSLLCVVYVFIGRNYVSPVRLWKSIAGELWWMKISLLDLGRPWFSANYMIYVSPWGAGAMRTRCNLEIVGHTDRFSERWRFKHGELLSLRMLSRKAIVQNVFDSR